RRTCSASCRDCCRYGATQRYPSSQSSSVFTRRTLLSLRERLRPALNGIMLSLFNGLVDDGDQHAADVPPVRPPRLPADREQPGGDAPEHSPAANLPHNADIVQPSPEHPDAPDNLPKHASPEERAGAAEAVRHRIIRPPNRSPAHKVNTPNSPKTRHVSDPSSVQFRGAPSTSLRGGDKLANIGLPGRGKVHPHPVNPPRQPQLQDPARDPPLNSKVPDEMRVQRERELPLVDQQQVPPGVLHHNIDELESRVIVLNYILKLELFEIPYPRVFSTLSNLQDQEVRVILQMIRLHYNSHEPSFLDFYNSFMSSYFDIDDFDKLKTTTQDDLFVTQSQPPELATVISSSARSSFVLSCQKSSLDTLSSKYVILSACVRSNYSVSCIRAYMHFQDSLLHVTYNTHAVNIIFKHAYNLNKSLLNELKYPEKYVLSTLHDDSNLRCLLTLDIRNKPLVVLKLVDPVTMNTPYRRVISNSFVRSNPNLVLSSILKYLEFNIESKIMKAKSESNLELDTASLLTHASSQTIQPEYAPQTCAYDSARVSTLLEKLDFVISIHDQFLTSIDLIVLLSKLTILCTISNSNEKNRETTLSIQTHALRTIRTIVSSHGDESQSFVYDSLLAHLSGIVQETDSLLWELDAIPVIKEFLKFDLQNYTLASGPEIPKQPQHRRAEPPRASARDVADRPRSKPAKLQNARERASPYNVHLSMQEPPEPRVQPRVQAGVHKLPNKLANSRAEDPAVLVPVQPLQQQHGEAGQPRASRDGPQRDPRKARLIDKYILHSPVQQREQHPKVPADELRQANSYSDLQVLRDAEPRQPSEGAEDPSLEPLLRDRRAQRPPGHPLPIEIREARQEPRAASDNPRLQDINLDDGHPEPDKRVPKEHQQQQNEGATGLGSAHAGELAREQGVRRARSPRPRSIRPRLGKRTAHGLQRRVQPRFCEQRQRQGPEGHHQRRALHRPRARRRHQSVHPGDVEFVQLGAARAGADLAPLVLAQIVEERDIRPDNKRAFVFLLLTRVPRHVEDHRGQPVHPRQEHVLRTHHAANADDPDEHERAVEHILKQGHGGRLSFVIHSSEKDQYAKYITNIQEKIAEALKIGVSGGNERLGLERTTVIPGIHNSVFLCFRIMVLKFNCNVLTTLWPIIVHEVVAVLTTLQSLLDGMSQEPTPPHALSLYLQTFKLLNYLFTLPSDSIPHFQLYKWAFTDSENQETNNNVNMFVPYVTKLKNTALQLFPHVVFTSPLKKKQVSNIEELCSSLNIHEHVTEHEWEVIDFSDGGSPDNTDL
ncbi:Protein dopey-1, partial [Orchesella cincta]